MSGFDNVETAQKVRDLLAKQAKRIVRQEAPHGLVGRVITVDPDRLKGTVWFPGDDAPVSVNFFSGTMPSTWQDKDQASGADTSLEQNSTQGYGSQVVAQRFNGLLYVTDILSGGQFSHRAEVMGISMIAQQPNVGNDGSFTYRTTGDPSESILTVRVGLKAMGRGDAILFGPFMRKDGTIPKASTFEISVRDVNGAGAKNYRFVVDPLQTMQNGAPGSSDPRSNNQWWRVLPEQELVGSGGVNSDWDFDINTVATAYSAVGGTDKDAFWFRVVSRNPTGTDFNLNITIKTSAFQRVGGFNTEQSFAQFRQIKPPEISGILGFHNASSWEAPGNYTVYDTYGRSEVNKWGNTFSSPTRTTGEPWIMSSGSTSEAGVDGTRGWLQHASANTTKSMRLTDNYTDVSLLAEFSIEKMPTNTVYTTWHEVGVELRRVDANNMIRVVAQFAFDGNVYFEIQKFVGGVKTLVDGYWIALSALKGGYTTAKKMTIIARMHGTKLTADIWLSDNGDEVYLGQSFGAIVTTISDAALQVASKVGVSSLINTGTTFASYPTRAFFHKIAFQVRKPITPTAVSPWQTGPYRSGLLRLASDLQRTSLLTAGKFGVITDANNYDCIYWSKDLFIGGVGAHRMGLPDGVARIPMPTDGTLIPVYPNFTTRAVRAAGIPMNTQETLYVGIQPSSGYYDTSYFLFIVSDTRDGNNDYLLPEWSVMIAHRGQEHDIDSVGFANFISPAIRLGNGTFADPVRLPNQGTVNNWFSYNGPYPRWFSVTKIDPNTVMLHGAVYNSVTSATTTIVTLDPEDRPLYQKDFIVPSGINTSALGTSKVIITPSGTVTPTVHHTNGGAGLLVLDGITYRIDR